MTFVAYIFVIIATVIAFRIGRPLIRLNFLNELFRASFRYALVRLRDNSENIAFYRGEPIERAALSTRFSAVIGNTWAIVFRNLKFQGFNLVVSQVAVVVPYIIQAPRYFSGAITLGDLTQTATAFGQVSDSLSFFRNAYDDFASYRAVLNRLTGLLDADADARALPAVTLESGDGLDVRGLTGPAPRRPGAHPGPRPAPDRGRQPVRDGPVGQRQDHPAAQPRRPVALRRRDGRRPLGDDALFLSQQPYVPLGNLRTALAYPGPAADIDDARAAAVLRQVQLPHLVDRLDEETDWTRRLSPGEQQRLGFARVLLVRPRVAFLDEATSALDEGMEHTLYTLLREELPDTMIVSVGHRSTLNRFHAERLELLGEGRWQVAALSH